MKTQRNSPCPCGSGKKYKKCCLLSEQAETQRRIVSRKAALREWLEQAKRNRELALDQIKARPDLPRIPLSPMLAA